ncbi:MAG: M20/M25/M40 family metallo-hydrolase [Nitrospirae bacterium]|nr:M20/M25/M40 family metallo-hydrolase [Nitrospirota bacterium]
MNISAFINKDRLVKIFIDLININSPSFGEKELGRLLSQNLKTAGCRVEVQKYDRSFNLIALKKGSIKDSSPLLLSGHMDTIEPTTGIRFETKGGIIRSIGNTVLGADDKSALAQIIETLMVLKEKKIPHGDIEIVFTSAEEKGLFGAKNLDFGRLKSRHALILDSGGPVGNLVIAAPSHITYEMRISGRPAHAGIEPEKGINAIRVSSEIIAAVPDGRIDAETTANIGMINGGTATNVVPKEVVIHGELRSHDKKTLRDTKKIIFDTAKDIAKKNRAGIRITDQEEYRAFRIDRKEPFLRFLGGVYKDCGVEPVNTVTGGGSDANIFNQQGILGVNISTGMQKVHSHDEYIHLNDLTRGCLVVLKTVMDFPGFRRDKPGR